jgi:hypothetical protein
MRGPSLFTERNVSRALRAMKKAGVVGRLEIDKFGTIAIITNDHTPLEPVAEKSVDVDPMTGWDEALGRRS